MDRRQPVPPAIQRPTGVPRAKSFNYYDASPEALDDAWAELDAREEPINGTPSRVNGRRVNDAAKSVIERLNLSKTELFTNFRAGKRPVHELNSGKITFTAGEAHMSPSRHEERHSVPQGVLPAVLSRNSPRPSDPVGGPKLEPQQPPPRQGKREIPADLSRSRCQLERQTQEPQRAPAALSPRSGDQYNSADHPNDISLGTLAKTSVSGHYGSEPAETLEKWRRDKLRSTTDEHSYSARVGVSPNRFPAAANSSRGMQSPVFQRSNSSRRAPRPPGQERRTPPRRTVDAFELFDPLKPGERPITPEGLISPRRAAQAHHRRSRTLTDLDLYPDPSSEASPLNTWITMD